MSQVNITGGPSKSDFLNYLGASNYKGTLATFTLTGGSTQEVNINQVQREDGGGDSFNFWNQNDVGTSTQTGYYDTSTQSGWLNQ